MSGRDPEAAFWQSHDEPPVGVVVSAAMVPSIADIVTLRERLKAHASAHYEDGGWDVIVECWSDAQIDKVLVDDAVTSFSAALASFEPLIGVWADRQADARNSAF
jgi:hypothetical protein